MSQLLESVKDDDPTETSEFWKSVAAHMHKTSPQECACYFLNHLDPRVYRGGHFVCLFLFALLYMLLLESESQGFQMGVNLLFVCVGHEDAIHTYIHTYMHTYIHTYADQRSRSR